MKYEATSLSFTHFLADDLITDT